MLFSTGGILFPVGIFLTPFISSFWAKVADEKGYLLCTNMPFSPG